MDPISFDDDNDDNSKRTRWNSLFRYNNKRYTAMIAVAIGVAVTIIVHLYNTVTTSDTSSSWSTGRRNQQQQQQRQQQRIRLVIPQCESSPWKENEDLMGTCPGDILKPVTAASSSSSSSSENTIGIKTAVECAEDCCHKPECITWQFRQDTGCLQGTQDIRIGQEKDGPVTYCSDHPPFKWNGQYIKDTAKDCSLETWQPNSQPGQCFGLGDVRDPQNIKTSQQCMERCCAEDKKKCGAWQFQPELGCFYGGGMQSCQPSDDPIVFEPFVGRRKIQPGRTYTDKDGNSAHSYSEKFMTTKMTTST